MWLNALADSSEEMSPRESPWLQESPWLIEDAEPSSDSGVSLQALASYS